MRRQERCFAVSLIIVLAMVMVGCGAAGGPPDAQKASAPTTIAVTISPNSVGLVANGTAQFTATVTGTSNTNVTWTTTAGSISATGMYTAPNVVASTTVTVQAISAADASASASAQVVVNAPTQSNSTYDQYGGLNSKLSPKGATGAWRMEKFGSHWMFVTPAGHAMWMKGVFDVAIDTHVDDLGSDYRTRILSKYGNLTNWAFFTNKRLKSWGFNTLAEYSMTYNIASAEKMPYVFFFRPSRYGLFANQYASSPTKDLIPGATASKYPGYRGGTVPDVFDPGFAAYANGALSGTTKFDPWMMGIAIDDSDGLYGFGPGPDVSTGHTSVHIGWLALITNPNQTSNASLNVSAYGDTKVYTKQALADFLQSKYSSISALNLKWGSNYTTFGSATGGFGVGTGILDEDGRNVWVGKDFFALSDSNSFVKADLDAFLYEYAKQYFSITTSAVRAYAARSGWPGVLVMGPATLNGWSGVSRQQVLKAAGQYLDVIQASVATQTVLDLTAQAAGDKPLITWEGAVANSDSALWRYPGGVATQAARAQWYQAQIPQDFNSTVTSTGSQPVVGMKFWALTDSWPERANWGLVTLSDNAYDGKEAVTTTSKDAYNFSRGGEEKNYGDFITTVTTTNKAIDTAVTQLP